MSHCIAITTLSSVFLLCVGCAGSQAPWDVAPEDEGRFQEATRVCRLLTDDDAGELMPDRFETCMTRRGWKRQGPIKRLLSRD